MKKHEIFETNPNLKEVHMTSDGELFYNDNDAKMHAKSLKDKSVELVVNPSLLEVITEEFEDFDELKLGVGSGEENTGIEAKADGSFAELNNEAPVVDTPVVEALAVDTSMVEAPAIDTPVVEAPAVDTSMVEAPKANSKKSK